MNTQFADFWEQRYVKMNTGWDIGAVSPPLQAYFDQLTNKELKILIPGAGNAYEVEYLYRKGFKNVHLLDWAASALKQFQQRVPDFPKKQLHQEDFFLHENQYDLIVEQTFFCAINPSLRTQYAEKMHNLLQSKGKLVGLWFNIPLNTDKPPFGGSKQEYETLFQDKFKLKTIKKAYNSIKPRENNELFLILEKKQALV